MDVFQGWYKDGTEGTYDYRPLSALYMLLRMVFSFAYFKLMASSTKYDLKLHVFEVIVGMLYALLGMMFLAFKPYKLNWMNHIDGNIFLLLAFYTLAFINTETTMYYITIATGLSVTLVISLCVIYKCLRKVIM